MDIIQEYKSYCERLNIPFQLDDKVRPYDDTTLFCPAGMQQFKSKFKDESYKGTIANVQSCIRMNDFDEIGDATHLLYFNMIGLFSFRDMTIKDAIVFWVNFLNKIGIKPDYVTIHSDKTEWIKHYNLLGIHDVRIDNDSCTWSDGEIGGYCTEFYLNDVEIGNIVNPLDNCIDVGFGLERLEMFVNGKTINKLDTLCETALKIINSGYKPSNIQQGYVLRKILREINSIGGSLSHEYFNDEIERQLKIRERYERLKDKHQDKPKEWWFDTHGINISDI
jgi:alanyl-tRNA synthetase